MPRIVRAQQGERMRRVGVSWDGPRAIQSIDPDSTPSSRGVAASSAIWPRAVWGVRTEESSHSSNLKIGCELARGGHRGRNT
jgi:hypothetical protein